MSGQDGLRNRGMATVTGSQKGRLATLEPERLVVILHERQHQSACMRAHKKQRFQDGEDQEKKRAAAREAAGRPRGGKQGGEVRGEKGQGEKGGGGGKGGGERGWERRAIATLQCVTITPEISKKAQVGTKHKQHLGAIGRTVWKNCNNCFLVDAEAK